MTESEIHSVMTAGFACIAGSLFSAYISFGVSDLFIADNDFIINIKKFQKMELQNFKKKLIFLTKLSPQLSYFEKRNRKKCS